jgi:hypothetical protein
MKKPMCPPGFLLSIVIASTIFISCMESKYNGLKLKVLCVRNGPVIKEGDPGTEGNKYGF